MKIVVLITSTLALILAYWKYKQSGKEICNENGHHDNGLCISDSPMLWNLDPCQTNTNNNAYNNFVRKHILQSVFNFNSMVEWESYLVRNGLCSPHRGTQSFIEISNPGPVVQICNGDGRQLYINTNYCISDSTMLESTNQSPPPNAIVCRP